MSDEVPAAPAEKEELVVYNFTVKGHYPDGNRARMHGTVVAKDGYPFDAFDKAVEACKRVTPGLIVDLTKPSQVVLKKRKSKKGANGS